MTDNKAIERILRELTKPILGVIGDAYLISTGVNHTFLVNTNTAEYYVKLMTRKPLDLIEQQRYLKSQMVYQKLHEKGVPSINVLHADAEPRQFNAVTIYGMMIMEKAPGQPLDTLWESWCEEQKIEFARSFAKFLQSVHSVEFPNFGRYDPSGDNTASWVSYIKNNLERDIKRLTSHGTIPEELLSKAQSFIESHLSELQYDHVPKLIHGDLWAGNVIYDTQTDEYVLVDWEWSIGGDPVKDLLWVDEVFYGDKDKPRIFYETYLIHDENIDIKRRCLNILSSIETCSIGWVFHNPSKDSFEHQAKLIRKSILG